MVMRRTTLTVTLVTIALFFDNSISVVYRAFTGTPNFALMNSMACHVYRNVKLGVYRESFGVTGSMSLPRHGRTVLSTTVLGSRNQGPDVGASSTRHDGQSSVLEVELDHISKTFLEKGGQRLGHSSDVLPAV